LCPFTLASRPAVSHVIQTPALREDFHGLISVVVVSDGALLAAQRPPRARAVSIDELQLKIGE
jgi:hypothetical protein